VGGTDATNTPGGGAAFTGFAAGELIHWFLLLLALGLVAVGSARWMRHVSPIGSTHGFD
jgi:hypothetical protein